MADKMATALLDYAKQRNSSDSLARLRANINAMEAGLLTDDFKVKPEFQNALEMAQKVDPIESLYRRLKA